MTGAADAAEGIARHAMALAVAIAHAHLIRVP
jgi:hypothetical protein